MFSASQLSQHKTTGQRPVGLSRRAIVGQHGAGLSQTDKGQLGGRPTERWSV